MTTGREVTVLLEDDGLETVGSVLSKIERELGSAIAGDQRISVNTVGVGDRYRCVDRRKSIDYYLIDGGGWLNGGGWLDGGGWLAGADNRFSEAVSDICPWRGDIRGHICSCTYIL